MFCNNLYFLKNGVNEAKKNFVKCDASYMNSFYTNESSYQKGQDIKATFNIAILLYIVRYVVEHVTPIRQGRYIKYF